MFFNNQKSISTIERICPRGIRTIAKFRLLTKIDFNEMHLIDLCKIFWQNLQIRGSSDLLKSAISHTIFDNIMQ